MTNDIDGEELVDLVIIYDDSNRDLERHIMYESEQADFHSNLQREFRNQDLKYVVYLFSHVMRISNLKPVWSDSLEERISEIAYNQFDEAAIRDMTSRAYKETIIDEI